MEWREKARNAAAAQYAGRNGKPAQMKSGGAHLTDRTIGANEGMIEQALLVESALRPGPCERMRCSAR